MDISDFGIALGVWQREEIITPMYQTAVQNFTEEVSFYWSQIDTPGAPYHSGISKATSIFPTFCYLHAIASQTLAGR